MGEKKWKWIRNNFYITCKVARTKLSKHFLRHITFGEYITMDEKMKKWRGQSNCAKKVLSKKNDPIGHWITQACVPLNHSNKPYVFGLYPFSGSEAEGNKNQEKIKIWEWLVDLINYHGSRYYHFHIHNFW